MTRPALKAVPDSGELPADGPQTLGEARQALANLEDVVAGLERDIRGWAIRYRNLERDKEAEARDSDEWPVLESLFAEWKKATGHRRSPFTLDRFELALPYLKNKRYGEEMIRRGIQGIAFDHFISTRRNGTKKHHDGWSVLFRDSDRFEDAVNSAPRAER